MIYSIVLFSLGIIFAQEYNLPSLKIVLMNLFIYLKQKSDEIQTTTQSPDTSYLNCILNFFKK